MIGILVYQIFFRKKKDKTQSPRGGPKGTTRQGQTKDKYEDTIRKLSDKTSELTKSLDKIKFDSGKFGELENSLNSLKKKL